MDDLPVAQPRVWAVGALCRAVADALGMAICHAHGGNTLDTLGGIAPALAKKGLRVRRGRLVG